MPAVEDKSFPLLSYLDGLVERLQKDTPKALREFDADAIHDARVATRRLKAAIELLEPILKSETVKPFKNAMKKLRRQLGPLRDSDVMIENLSKLTDGAHAPASKWLSSQLSADRDKARAEAAKVGPGKILSKVSAWWELRDSVAESEEAVKCLLAESVHLRLDEFVEHAKQTTNPHEMRIAGKALRYTLEMADEQGHALPKSVLKGFKTIQQYLGDWHDNVVIVQSAMQHTLDLDLAYKDMSLQQMLNLCRFFTMRAEKEFAKFAKTWSSHGEELTSHIRNAFPLTRAVLPQSSAPATESNTDPGPSHSTPPAAQEAPMSDVAATA